MTDATPAAAVFAVNGGSSTIKFALFADHTAAPSLSGVVTGIGTPIPVLVVDDAQASRRRRLEMPDASLRAIVERILEAVESCPQWASLACIVHRVVHGGEQFDRPTRITTNVIAGLRGLIPLAPNHLPDEIALIETFMALRPQIPQVACFDTAFHHDLPPVSRTLPVPPSAGLRRYGFHGLSYGFLLSELKAIGGDEALGRVVLAHLGSGASLAALFEGRPVDTSMGLTPTGGLVMSSRAGDLDPGIVTYLARRQGLSLDEVDRLLTREAGLVALSGGVADMQELLAREASDPRARLAVDVFCYQVRKWIGAFAAVLGGLDTLVFSGGIGEHAPIVRSRICSRLAFLGVQLAEDQNAIDAPLISIPTAGVVVRVIPTNEALMMAREARTVLAEAAPATQARNSQ